MIHPISPNVNNTAIYFGAKLYADKNTPPKADTTNSSASAAARGDNGDLKTGITSSSAKDFAKGTPPALEKKPMTNMAAPETIASATASFNTPSVDLMNILKADSEKEYKAAQAGKPKETPAEKAREALKANDALKVIASNELKSPAIITLKKSVTTESAISAYKQ
jgi:hypothetical protein